MAKIKTKLTVQEYKHPLGNHVDSGFTILEATNMLEDIYLPERRIARKDLERLIHREGLEVRVVKPKR